MHVSIGLPSPKWLLKLGALFIKTETELVLKSRWVLPENYCKKDIGSGMILSKKHWMIY